MHSQELLEDTAITLKFSERGISGSSGCNFYSAQYTRQPKNGIEIGEVANTEMGCSNPAGILEQGEAYISTIQKAISYRLNAENLFMMDAQGNILLQYRLLPKFEGDPEGLFEKTWRLVYADGMEEYELSAFTLWFNRSTFGGTTVCRDYEGDYQLVEESIRVTSLRMPTDLGCAQEELLTEGTYTSFFVSIDQFNVSQNRLELYTVQNDKLIYEIVSEEYMK
jgi:heat shock protein HslJ